jgi:hypothetical protein
MATFGGLADPSDDPGRNEPFLVYLLGCRPYIELLFFHLLAGIKFPPHFGRSRSVKMIQVVI